MCCEFDCEWVMYDSSGYALTLPHTTVTNALLLDLYLRLRFQSDHFWQNGACSNNCILLMKSYFFILFGAN